MNIILRNMQKSPERCIRNLLELGLSINKKSKEIDTEELFPIFLVYCKNNDRDAVKELFNHTFLDY
jgi:hypothetical protein